MKYVRPILRAVAAVAAFAPFAPIVRTQAQARPEIQHIASQAAKKISKTQPRTILTTPLAGCLGAPDLCEEFDGALRAALDKILPEVQFIRRENALRHLANHGFLSVDAYLGALDNVASDAGAEVVVGENFQRKPSSCKFHITVSEAKHLYALEDLDAGISCSAAPAKTILSLLKDPATGVSLVVPLPRPPDAPPGPSLVRYPSCVSPGGCPEPRYTGFARQKGLQGAVHILMTVTEQGKVEDATALGAVDEGLARASVETVRGWHLHAAIGPDGKPFRARVPVEVDFRLLPR